MSTPRLRVEVGGGVADVRLNRPEKLNALDPDMFDALIDTAAALAADPTLRAVVISGEGRGFCAGLDLSLFAGLAGASDPTAGGAGADRLFERPAGRLTNRAQQAVWGWAELPVPVIAALHGAVLGGGLQLALAADIRLVDPDAQLSVAEIRWGLIPDMTGTWTLSRLLAPDVAKDLVWTGRVVSGTEAVQLGLATRLSLDPRDEALVLAGELARRSPDAVRAGKRLLGAAGRRGAGETFLAEEEANRSLLGSPNQLEAVRAGLEGRAPTFSDVTDSDVTDSDVTDGT